MGTHRDPASKRASRLAHLSDAERALIARVGGRITALRDRAGRMTIAELARQAGLHPSYVGEVERGQANASLTSLCRIAAALDVSVSDIVAESALPP